MRATTLSESILGANSLPSLFPKPPKSSLSTCLLSLEPRSKNHSSKLSLRNPTFNSSRHASLWCANTCEEWFGRLLHTSQNSDGLDIRNLDYKNCRETPDKTPFMEDYGTLDKTLAKKITRRQFHKIRKILFSDNSACHFLKTILLFGFLTLQGSPPAFASPDFTSGMQSIPYLSDLGDISTGFASAFLLIFFSELGDKTFFIAALLAARNSAAVVFTGTFGALAVMTIISVALGRTFHYVDEILPFRFGGADLPVDDIAAVFLLRWSKSRRRTEGGRTSSFRSFRKWCWNTSCG